MAEDFPFAGPFTRQDTPIGRLLKEWRAATHATHQIQSLRAELYSACCDEIRQPRPQPVEKALVPLPVPNDDKWHAACRRLEDSPSEIGRIAEWRGIDPDAVRWAAGANLMGIYSYFSEPREAFLVEAAVAEDRVIPVSVHIRLAPGTKGNDSSKSSWRYDPAGVGSWPFLAGNPATARHIFVLEGQWDALALISIMGWFRKWPPNVAVFGLRGSTSGAKLLQHAINPDAFIFTFADSDPAGDKWFEEDGFLTRLTAKLTYPQRVHGFQPADAGRGFQRHGEGRHHGPRNRDGIGDTRAAETPLRQKHPHLPPLVPRRRPAPFQPARGAGRSSHHPGSRRSRRPPPAGGLDETLERPEHPG